MKFTFGILTCLETSEYLYQIIQSIEKENIPEYEIIIVGNCSDNIKMLNKVKNIPFIEYTKFNVPLGANWEWITRKKNIITENAQYDNIVYMHDYVVLGDEWYNGWLKYGEDFKVCQNIIKNADGTRYRDWVVHPLKIIKGQRPIGNQGMLPYDLQINENINRLMYISGEYWVAKKYIMQEFPLDERRKRGEQEDLYWSAQYTSKYKFSINTLSYVQFLKQKLRHIHESSKYTLDFIKNFNMTAEQRLDMFKNIEI